MRLRPVELSDVDMYVRMRCDPVMMAELGGVQPREGLEAKVARDVRATSARRPRDVRATAANEAWILMIVPHEAEPHTTAGTVAIFKGGDAPAAVSEIGWMVLPEFQGRGLGEAAVRSVLQRAARERLW